MNTRADPQRKPIDSLEISGALVRLIEREQGLRLGVRDIGARPSLSGNGQFLYMVLTLRSGIDDAVAKALTAVSKHVKTAVGAWVLSEREVRLLLRNAAALCEPVLKVSHAVVPTLG